MFQNHLILEHPPGQDSPAFYWAGYFFDSSLRGAALGTVNTMWSALLIRSSSVFLALQLSTLVSLLPTDDEGRQ
jgi:hypothetical protein